MKPELPQFSYQGGTETQREHPGWIVARVLVLLTISAFPGALGLLLLWGLTWNRSLESSALPHYVLATACLGAAGILVSLAIVGQRRGAVLIGFLAGIAPMIALVLSQASD